MRGYILILLAVAFVAIIILAACAPPGYMESIRATEIAGSPSSYNQVPVGVGVVRVIDVDMNVVCYVYNGQSMECFSFSDIGYDE